MFIEDVTFVDRVLPKDMRPNKEYLMNFSRTGLEKIYRVLKDNKNLDLEEMSSGTLVRSVFNLWTEQYSYSASVRFKSVKNKEELTELLNETFKSKLSASKVLEIFSREELEFMYNIYTGGTLTGIYKDNEIVHLVMTNYYSNPRCTVK